MDHSLKFKEEYNKEYPNKEKLLEYLDPTIKRITKLFYKRTYAYIDVDDIVQECRIYIWNRFLNNGYKHLPENSEDVYKYFFTAIKRFVLRTLTRLTNKQKRQNKIKKIDAYVTRINLSILNAEYCNIVSDLDCNIYVERLREICKDIPDAGRVLDYIAPKENHGKDDTFYTIKYAGLPINRFYNTIKKIRNKTKELDYE